MSLTVEKIINLYLYAQLTTPTNKIDNDLIRESLDPEEFGAAIYIDRGDFMSTGAGRFANASMIELVEEFFSATTIAEGTYTRSDIITELGLDADAFELDITQIYYQDNTDDYAERTLIFNSGLFGVNEGASFVVTSTGERSIENFSVRPYFDNFDFDSNNFFAALANSSVGDAIDPSGIGRKVEIGFTGDVATSTYTEPSYTNDQATVASWDDGDLSKLEFDVADIAEDLWNSGTTKFLDGLRPILYGTTDGDNLNGGSINGSLWADLNGVPTIDDSAYEGQGVVLVAGDGDDDLRGTHANDLLIGGDGANSYRFAPGDGEDMVSGDGDNDLSDEIIQIGSGIVSGVARQRYYDR